MSTYKIEEIKIITPNLPEQSKRLIRQCIDNMRYNIFWYSKNYGEGGIRIAVEKNNNLAKRLLDVVLFEVRDELSDLGILGIPYSYGVAYLPENPQRDIEKDEIVGKIKTYCGDPMGSLIVVRNKINQKEEIYLSIKD